MNKLVTLGMGAVLALGMSVNSGALLITPADPIPLINTGTDPSQDVITKAIEDYVLANYECDDLAEAYKATPGDDEGKPQSEEWADAPYYSTAFFNSPTDPEDATITWDGPSSISADLIFLLVKDGNHTPTYYFYDISTWNGTDDIVMENFWPQQGAISHVSIYTCDDAPDTNIPDGGTTAVLLGMALLGLGGIKRAIRD